MIWEADKATLGEHLISYSSFKKKAEEECRLKMIWSAVKKMQKDSLSNTKWGKLKATRAKLKLADTQQIK